MYDMYFEKYGLLVENRERSASFLDKKRVERLDCEIYKIIFFFLYTEVHKNQASLTVLSAEAEAFLGTVCLRRLQEIYISLRMGLMSFMLMDNKLRDIFLLCGDAKANEAETVANLCNKTDFMSESGKRVFSQTSSCRMLAQTLILYFNRLNDCFSKGRELVSLLDAHREILHKYIGESEAEYNNLVSFLSTLLVEKKMPFETFTIACVERAHKYIKDLDEMTSSKCFCCVGFFSRGRLNRTINKTVNSLVRLMSLYNIAPSLKMKLAGSQEKCVRFKATGSDVSEVYPLLSVCKNRAAIERQFAVEKEFSEEGSVCSSAP